MTRRREGRKGRRKSIPPPLEITPTMLGTSQGGGDTLLF
jgi:hypothetical protein